MSEMQFDTPDDEFGRPPEQKPGIDIMGKLVSWGLAKDRQQAQYVLLGVAVVAIVLALIIYF